MSESPLPSNFPALSRLTPGETMFFLNPGKVKGEDILRVTFQDLMLRRVLDFIIRPHPTHTRIKMYIVKHGRAFVSTAALPHEQLITRALRAKAYMDLRHMTDEWLRACGSKKEFFREHLRTNRIEPYMEDKFRDRYLGRLKLNEQGEKMALRINTEIQAANNAIQTWDDPVDQQLFMQTVKGHVMLMEVKDWPAVKLLRGVGAIFDQCMGLASERAYGD